MAYAWNNITGVHSVCAFVSHSDTNALDHPPSSPEYFISNHKSGFLFINSYLDI